MKNERMRREQGNWYMRAVAYYAGEAFVVPTAMRLITVWKIARA